METVQACKYMTDGAVMPFCKGCGHSNVLLKLNEALESIQILPKDVCLVTDIGCIGLADELFDKVHTVHTTHGRSTGFATGITIADKVLAEKRLKTIVLIGDGGSMIGLLHIVNAALLNVDMTVIVCNNFLFGMTGGQQSSLTPEHFITQTTPFGSINPGLDICAIADASNAGFVARKTSSDKDLAGTIEQAIRYDGFSLIEVLELCTEHAVKPNALKGNMLAKMAEDEGKKMGIIKNDNSRKEFGKRYLESHCEEQSDAAIPTECHEIASSLCSSQLGIIIAGSAGERVQSSAALLCNAAMRCGLNTTQKNDNPVTQGSGFSLSEVILSPEEICYTGVEKPSFVIAVSQDGIDELNRQGVFERFDEKTILIIDEGLSFPQFSDGYVLMYPLRKFCGGERAALGAIDCFIKTFSPFPHPKFAELLLDRYGSYENLFKKEFYALA